MSKQCWNEWRRPCAKALNVLGNMTEAGAAGDLLVTVEVLREGEAYRGAGGDPKLNPKP